MRELARELLAGREAWVVGGAVRDELLGRELVDLDIAVREPEGAARAYANRSGGAPFPLSERHGAWRVALAAGHTVDFTPFAGTIEEDLATRDFTINAIAVPLAGGEAIDPFAGRADLDARLIRVVSPSVFTDDPLRLMRAVRLEDELGFRLEPETERLVRRARRARHRAGTRADARRAGEALGRRLPPRGRARAAGAARGLEHRPRPARARRPACVPPRRGLRRRAPPLSGLERDEALRAEASPRAGARGRLRPVDPPLPPRDRAVVARRPGLRRCAGARGRGSRGAGARARRNRCYAGTSSACRPAPRSAACSS